MEKKSSEQGGSETKDQDKLGDKLKSGKAEKMRTRRRMVRGRGGGEERRREEEASITGADRQEARARRPGWLAVVQNPRVCIWKYDSVVTCPIWGSASCREAMKSDS